MSTELTYLAYTAILTASLWTVYIACQVMTNGPLSGENYVDPTQRPVPLWGQRANRVYLNAVEAFAPFAALTIINHIANKETSTTVTLVMAFFWLRVIHAVVYWFAVPYVRTISFTLAWLCVVGLFWHVIS